MKKVKIKTPQAHLTTVYSVSDPMQAELIKNMLADHQIEARLGGEHQAGFTGVMEIEIIVRESDAKSALEFIQHHFPGA